MYALRCAIAPPTNVLTDQPTNRKKRNSSEASSRGNGLSEARRHTCKKPRSSELTTKPSGLKLLRRQESQIFTSWFTPSSRLKTRYSGVVAERVPGFVADKRSWIEILESRQLNVSGQRNGRAGDGTKETPERVGPAPSRGGAAPWKSASRREAKGGPCARNRKELERNAFKHCRSHCRLGGHNDAVAKVLPENWLRVLVVSWLGTDCGIVFLQVLCVVSRNAGDDDVPALFRNPTIRNTIRNGISVHNMPTFVGVIEARAAEILQRYTLMFAANSAAPGSPQLQGALGPSYVGAWICAVWSRLTVNAGMQSSFGAA